MTVVPLFSIFSLLLLCVNTQTPPDVYYSAPVDGAEIINFLSSTALSYASNLQMDLNSTSDDVYTLYFTAGRRLSNLYTAQFQTLPTNINKKFWATGVPIETSASPFLTFSVVGNNILGPAFPTNASNIAGFVIQSVYLGPQTTVYEYNTPGLNFVATIISPIADPTTGNHYVYLAGWDNQTNLVIARATMKPNQNDPAFLLNMDNDVLTIFLTDPPCYDQFDEVAHPLIYLTPNELVVLVPKRCSLFVKVTLPPDPLINFNDASSQTFSPASANEIYVSSAVFDPDYSIIFYTLKAYNIPGAKLYSFDAIKWIPNPIETDLDLIEAETLLVLGVEKDSTKTTRFIFIVASGSNRVQRLTIANNHTFNTLTAAALSPSFNRISSAWYFRPSLYFTTYEPDAKVGRIAKSNFCKDWCGDFGYCTNGYCSCRAGYTFDGTDPTNLCVPESLVNEKDKERETEGAAATLGVLFAFSLLAAIAGWVMWWRTRKLQKLPGSY